MILTGPEIEKQVAAGRINITPWVSKNAGPNSVDLRLHPEIQVYREVPLDMRRDNPTQKRLIPDFGMVLQPGILYLGRTVERIHTDFYVPKVDGRSSIGRLGMQVHVTAGFCDTGFDGTITLEMTVVHALRVYAGVRICQVCFTEPVGELRLYKGRYQGQTEATASRFYKGGETVR